MAPWLDASVFGLTLFFMLIGLFGMLVPLFPGILVMWVSALIYGITVGFTTLGIIIFVLITILAIVAMFIDNILLGAGAAKTGAAWWTILLGMLVGLIGTLVWPPLGGILGTPLAILLLEYLRQKDWRKAIAALKGAAIGWGVSFVIRFALGIVMVLLWVAWAVLKA